MAASQADIERLVFEQRVSRYLINVLGHEDGKVVFDAGQTIQSLDERTVYYSAVVKDVQAIASGSGPQAVKNASIYKWEPVSIREFIEGEEYLNKKADVYPKVMEELEEINSGKYVEVVLTGGIGSAKTTSALYTTAYQLYLLSCLREPHKLYGLDSASEILFIFQSISEKLAKGVDFMRFKSMIESSKYFREKFPFKRDIESKLVFPNRIEVLPVSGQETAAIGQNVIGGVIDELNYMSVVEKSKNSVDKGTYDQAVALYNSIARRRKSRFMRQGKMPGILCLVSSKRYPGQFTDQKEAESKKELKQNGSTTIYVYDYCVWEIKPPGSFSGEMFTVFVGDIARKPRIIKEGETLSLSETLMTKKVPVEFRGEFETDIINALREIAGVSTLARHPYMVNVELVAQSFNRHKSIFTRDKVDFVETKLGIITKNFVRPDLPRFVHVDLAISGDSAGFCVGCCTGFASMKKLGLGDSDLEQMPKIHIDGIVEIAPPKNGEILFWKIRKIITDLRQLGLNIRWVTFDSFESKDSQQLLRQQGFITGMQSVDRTSTPYDFLKQAFYTGRIAAPQHKKCLTELISLEKDTKTGKVDHPPSGSKDCSDAMAGVVFGLTIRREIWAMYHIPLMSLPSSISVVEPEDDPKK